MNQRYEAYKGFTGHEPGIKPIKALPGMNANQNQRYSCLMAFTGYEALMDFPVWHSPGMNRGEYAAKPRLPRVGQISTLCLHFIIKIVGKLGSIGICVYRSNRSCRTMEALPGLDPRSECKHYLFIFQVYHKWLPNRLIFQC